MTEDQKKLAMDNINLVHYVLHKRFNWVCPGSYDYEDLFQQGCEQLCKCAINFDPQAGFEFSTYAINSIWGYINNYVRYDFDSRPGRRTKDGSKMERLDICSGNIEIENHNDHGQCELLDLIPDTESLSNFDICELRELFIMAFTKASPRYGKDILDLLLLGHTQNEIANILFNKSRAQANISKIILRAKTIFDSACNFDLRYPEQEILKLHSSGISRKTIASILNVSQNYVNRTINMKGDKYDITK